MQIFLQLFSIKFALFLITRKWRNNDQEDTIRQAIARQVPFVTEGFFLLPIPEFSGMGSNFFQSRVREVPSFQSKKSINRIREFLWSFLACLQKKQYADFYTVIDMFRSF